MPFTDIVTSTRQVAIRRLAMSARLFHYVRQTARTPLARQTASKRTSAACSRLLAMRAAQVANVLPASGLVTIALPDGKRVNVPVTYLEPAAKQLVARFLEEYVTNCCS